MALERKGVRTVVGDRNREIRKANSVIKSITKQIRSIKEWLEGFTEKLRQAEKDMQKKSRYR